MNRFKQTLKFGTDITNALNAKLSELQGATLVSVNNLGYATIVVSWMGVDAYSIRITEHARGFCSGELEDLDNGTQLRRWRIVPIPQIIDALAEEVSDLYLSYD